MTFLVNFSEEKTGCGKNLFGHQATQVIQGDATRNAVIINALIYVTKNSGKQRDLCEMFDLGELSWDWNRCKFAAAKAFLTVIPLIHIADWTFFEIPHQMTSPNSSFSSLSRKSLFLVMELSISGRPKAYFYSRKIFCCSPRFESYRFYFIHHISERKIKKKLEICRSREK